MDDAASISMTERRYQNKVAQPEVLPTHCYDPRKHLAAKKLFTELNIMMNDAVKIINEISSRGMISRLFTILCESIDTRHQHPLLNEFLIAADGIQKVIFNIISQHLRANEFPECVPPSHLL